MGAEVPSPTPLCQAVTSHHIVSGEFTHSKDVLPTNAKHSSWAREGAHEHTCRSFLLSWLEEGNIAHKLYILLCNRCYDTSLWKKTEEQIPSELNAHKCINPHQFICYVNVLFWLHLGVGWFYPSFCPIERFPLLVPTGTLSSDYSYKDIYSRRKHLRRQNGRGERNGSD